MIPTCYNCGWRYLGKDTRKCPVNCPNCGSRRVVVRDLKIEERQRESGADRKETT